MTEKEQLERLQALSAVQTADINAVFLLVSRLAEIVRRNHPDTPDMSDTFLKVRKHFLQQHLESIETSNPALAARLQQLIDQSCTIFPPTYE
jgi:hypothetical protein